MVANQLVFNPGSDFDHLAQGATATVTLSYNMTDEHGAASSSTVTVTVTPRTGAAKSVTDYGRFGPPDLWMLEQAIDGIIGRITWTGRGGFQKR